MKKELFLTKCFPLARQAGAAFDLNPVVLLAQAALESGWGTSRLAVEYHNYFGITAFGKPNDFWNGAAVALGVHGLSFRRYSEPQMSFMDHARLLRARYKLAAEMSFHPEAFAKEIAYSAYISEQNGDNREQYRKNIVRICKGIHPQPPEGGAGFVCRDAFRL